MREPTRNINKLLNLSRELLFLADKGDLQREDESCGVLFGVVRDAAYKIWEIAEREREMHLKQGTWDGDDINA
jgi:hypothetical protein